MNPALFHPQIDRLPPHRQRPIMISPDDAVMECYPDCGCCEVLFSLRRFYEEVEGR